MPIWRVPNDGIDGREIETGEDAGKSGVGSATCICGRLPGAEGLTPPSCGREDEGVMTGARAPGDNTVSGLLSRRPNDGAAFSQAGLSGSASMLWNEGKSV